MKVDNLLCVLSWIFELFNQHWVLFMIRGHRLRSFPTFTSGRLQKNYFHNYENGFESHYCHAVHIYNMALLIQNI